MTGDPTPGPHPPEPDDFWLIAGAHADAARRISSTLAPVLLDWRDRSSVQFSDMGINLPSVEMVYRSAEDFAEALLMSMAETATPERINQLIREAARKRLNSGNRSNDVAEAALRRFVRWLALHGCAEHDALELVANGKLKANPLKGRSENASLATIADLYVALYSACTRCKPTFTKADNRADDSFVVFSEQLTKALTPFAKPTTKKKQAKPTSRKKQAKPPKPLAKLPGRRLLAQAVARYRTGQGWLRLGRT